MATTFAKPRSLAPYYGSAVSEIRPGDFDFRLQLLRIGAAPVFLERTATSFFWEESGDVPYLTGEVVLQRPDPADAGSMPVGNGHRVRCSVRWAGQWYVLWTMRVWGVPDVDLATGTVTVVLRDDLDLVQRGTRRWRFRKTKAHKFGWFPHEVAREVARSLGLKLGQVARGRFRVPSFSLHGTGLAAIKKAYAHETERTGIDYFLRSRDGVLDVIPMRRNETLYVIGKQVTSAIVRGQQAIRPVTVIRAKGRLGKASGARKVAFTAFVPDVLRRFGRSEEEWDAGRVDSAQELRERAQRRLANKLRVRRTADLTVPGVPFLRRADGVRWRTTEAGWFGSSYLNADRSFVFLTYVRHTVSSDVYKTDITVQQEDPFVKALAAQDKAARAAKRAARKAAAKK